MKNTRPLVLVLVVALGVALAGCSRSREATRSKDPNAQLLAHTDRMIQILKDNQADPGKAVQELASYQAKNRAEIERLKQTLGESMQKDPMRAAAVSSIYGMKSAELDVLTKEMEAKAAAR